MFQLNYGRSYRSIVILREGRKGESKGQQGSKIRSIDKTLGYVQDLLRLPYLDLGERQGAWDVKQEERMEERKVRKDFPPKQEHSESLERIGDS